MHFRRRGFLGCLRIQISRFRSILDSYWIILIQFQRVWADKEILMSLALCMGIKIQPLQPRNNLASLKSIIKSVETSKSQIWFKWLIIRWQLAQTIWTLVESERIIQVYLQAKQTINLKGPLHWYFNPRIWIKWCNHQWALDSHLIIWVPKASRISSLLH